MAVSWRQPGPFADDESHRRGGLFLETHVCAPSSAFVFVAFSQRVLGKQRP